MQRLAEMEAGRRRVQINMMLEKVDNSTAELRRRFPTLRIDGTIYPPYTHVTIAASSKDQTQEITFEDLAKDYPSDALITQLALIA